MQPFYTLSCQRLNIPVMKKYFKFFVLIGLCSFILTACVKDKCSSTYTNTYYIPIYKTIPGVKANIKSNAPKEIENPGKLFLYGNYIFLNEIDKGIHIIDNSNPQSPRNVAFIDIPGNLDVAVKGNTLYADLYTDLVTIDITDPLQAVVKKYNERIFPARYYGGYFSIDSTQIIVDWIKKDTTIKEDCGGTPWWQEKHPVYYSRDGIGPSALAGAGTGSSPVGIGGSMARLTLLNNYLYTVGDVDLSTFDISNSINPVFLSKTQVDWHVETIYPFKDKLFVGSNNGMFIYDVQSTPAHPVRLGQFIHVRACDPVIADDNYAYVTLHSGSTCLGYNNQLDIVQLNNLTNSTLTKTYEFTSPHGLAKDGNLLFICDGTAGLKIYNASNVMGLQLLKQFSNIETYDVIAYNNIALVVAKDALYQYDYSNVNDIKLISKMGISK